MIVGVFKTSLKENEKRIPIYPDHINKIPEYLLSALVFENGYGDDFGYTDTQLEKIGCKFNTREQLFVTCDMLVLPKPTLEDMKSMKDNQILCGWTHAVQNREITDIAIEKKLTLMAWEEMNHIDKSGKLHMFYRNNELAGYAGILHYLELVGMDGHYGERKKVIILGFGSVSRGAIYALQGRGFNNITVITKRPVQIVADKNPDVWYKNINDPDVYEDFKTADIIFNGVLQDVNDPLMFITDDYGLSKLKSKTAIIDISCDKGMGFYFAEPTSFEKPIIKLERGINYYSVDHTPTYLWNAASREISQALLPLLGDIMNPAKWEGNKIIHNSIDILNGVIKNPNINKFQKR